MSARVLWPLYLLPLGGCSLLVSLEGLEKREPVADASTDAMDGNPFDGGDALLGDASTDAGEVSTVVAIEVGGQDNPLSSGAHACAIAGGKRELFCWGANEHGQLGIGTQVDANKPTLVAKDSYDAPFDSIDSVATGSWNTCAKYSGGYACWGLRQQGGVGDGIHASPMTTPKRFPTAFPVLELGGAHGCVGTLNDLRCFGASEEKQSGLFQSVPCTWFLSSSGPCKPTPAMTASFLAALSQVSLGIRHSCFVQGDGVQCWGSGLDLENGWTSGSTVDLIPITTNGTSKLTGVVSLSARGRHACALRSEGNVYCWGKNDAGQLGQPAGAPSANAVQVPSLIARSIAVGEGASCAIVGGDEHVECWGNNSFGQLGDGTTKSTPTPVTVRGPSGTGKLVAVKRVTLAYGFACALTADKSVYCWGNNDHGQLGDGTTQPRTNPTRVTLP